MDRLAPDEPSIPLKDREGTISTPFRKIFAIICLSPVSLHSGHKTALYTLPVWPVTNDPAVLTKVRDMISDPAPEADAMRDMAMRCAQEKNWRETVPAIRAYLRSTNESVRISAIWVLGKFGDEESRPVFVEAASSPRPRIQSAGKLALANLNASAGNGNIVGVEK
jgi:hypothetical protein